MGWKVILWVILGLVILIAIGILYGKLRWETLTNFAEAAWYPTALLPSQGVLWEAIDDSSAQATLIDGDITLTMMLQFNNAGLIEMARAEARGRRCEQ